MESHGIAMNVSPSVLSHVMANTTQQELGEHTNLRHNRTTLDEEREKKPVESQRIDDAPEAQHDGGEHLYPAGGPEKRK